MFGTLSEKFGAVLSLVSGKKKIERADIESTLEQVKQAMLQADIPYDIVKNFTEKVAQQLLGHTRGPKAQLPEQVMVTLYRQLTELMGGASGNLDKLLLPIPSTIMLVGLQGSGKTTTAAKLAYRYMQLAAKQNKKRYVMLASVDYDRPAAIDQLEILAGQVGCQFYRSQATDAISAAKDIVAYAKQAGIEYLILDTAGRMHVDQEMLGQLKSITAIAKPRATWLVIDGMVGQQSLMVAREFHAAVGIDGAIVTKMDSEVGGGAIIALYATIAKPVIAVGQGEKIQDLEPLYAERIAQRIIGMGDIKTLSERLESVVTKAEEDKISASFKSGSLTFEDFLASLEMMKKIGSLGSLLKYLPGAGQLKLTPEMIQQGEQDLRRVRAIIQSMTPKERKSAKLLDGTRKLRVAKGAGVTVEQIDSLVSRFEQTQQFVKLLKKNNNFALF